MILPGVLRSVPSIAAPQCHVSHEELEWVTVAFRVLMGSGWIRGHSGSSLLVPVCTGSLGGQVCAAVPREVLSRGWRRVWPGAHPAFMAD